MELGHVHKANDQMGEEHGGQLRFDSPMDVGRRRKWIQQVADGGEIDLEIQF
jgi:hypothetical protein